MTISRRCLVVRDVTYCGMAYLILADLVSRRVSFEFAAVEFILAFFAIDYLTYFWRWWDQ